MLLAEGILTQDEIPAAKVKIAVELTVLQNIVAANTQIDETTLQRVRGICVNEVKKINGIISFDEAVRWQS